jgi:hypothetical protein
MVVEDGKLLVDPSSVYIAYQMYHHCIQAPCSTAFTCFPMLSALLGVSGLGLSYAKVVCSPRRLTFTSRLLAESLVWSSCHGYTSYSTE